MTLSRLFAIPTLMAILPVGLEAQAGNAAQIFTSIDNSFPGSAGVAGFGLSLGNGAIGVRGSFGVGMSAFSTSSSSNTSPLPRQWTGDADLVIGQGLGGLAGIFGGALEPYAFAGLGAQSVSASPSASAATKTWSYGGGITVPLASSIAINGEVRYRNQLGNNLSTASDFVNGSEYRIGLSFNFGARRSAARHGSRSGSASSPPRPTGGGRTGSTTRTTWPASSTTAAAAARRVVPDAERYIGVPYVYGGSSPSGFDCSGFVQYVYARQGVELPRTSRQMASSGIAINPSPRAMAIGDLMLFTQGGQISHVAIYAGSGRFIHSSSSGHGVRYDDLNTQRGQWFADHLVAVRRVAGDGRAAVAAFAQSFIPFDHFDPPDSAPPARNK
jgi:cell wall-associated NlpC family hydrolase